MQKGGEKQGHKWFARIGQSGAYKYFYSQAELAAYKAHQAGSAIKNKIDTTKNKIATAKRRMEVKKKVNDIYKGHEKARKIAEKFEKRRNSTSEAFKNGFSYTYSVRKDPKKMEERLREVAETKPGSLDDRRLINRAMTERDAKKGRLKNFSKTEVQRLADSYNKKGFVRLEPTIQEEKFDKFKKQAYKNMNDAEKKTNDKTKQLQKKADAIRKESNEIKNKPKVSSEYQQELESNSKKNKYFGMTKKEAPGSGHFTYDSKTGQTVYVKPDGTKVRKKKH